MPTVLKAGRNGNTAEVNVLGQLQVNAVTEPKIDFASIRGRAFVLSHPKINLTTASQSWIFYGTNADTVNWIVKGYTMAFGPSTGGSGDFDCQVVINPTAGTLITAGTPSIPINLNPSSLALLPGTFLYGAEGSTITNGRLLDPGMVVSDQNVVAVLVGPITITPGTSFALSITPPTGNTSMNVQLSVSLFRDFED